MKAIVPRIIIEINIQSQAEVLFLLACTCISAIVEFFELTITDRLEAHKLCPCYTIILSVILKQKGSLKEPLSFNIAIPGNAYVDFNTPDFVEVYSGLH